MSVPACGEDCPAPDWTSQESVGPYKWCGFPVELPHNKWPDIGDKYRKALSDNQTIAALQEIDLWIVEEPREIQPAIDALYASMKDPIIGIDTEWKPDSKQEENNIALISLASSSCVVLLRTCSLDRCGVWGVPKAVSDFCKNDEIVGVGFAWDLSDEKKMQRSFSMGRRDLFSHFIDVKPLSEMLGYQDTSIGTLAKRVLGFEPPKSPQITVSNWEAGQVDGRQVRYAALDSLIAGDIFRTLRFYHHHKMECTGCNVPLGVWPGDLDLHCAAPECARKKAFASVSALMSHARSTDDYEAAQRQRMREQTPIQPRPPRNSRHASQAHTPVPPEAQPVPQREREDDDFTLESLLEQSLSVTAKPAEQADDPVTSDADPVVKVQARKQKHMPSRRRKKDHSMYAAYASFT